MIQTKNNVLFCLKLYLFSGTVPYGKYLLFLIIIILIFPIAPSLKTLLNELTPLRHIWRKICIQLGISSSHLRVFKKSDDDPFTRSLDFWLNGNTDVPITWGSVVAALASPYVGEYLFAKRLREKWSTSKESEQIYEKTDGCE